jgi:hypothetical protein
MGNGCLSKWWFLSADIQRTKVSNFSTLQVFSIVKVIFCCIFNVSVAGASGISPHRQQCNGYVSLIMNFKPWRWRQHGLRNVGFQSSNYVAQQPRKPRYLFLDRENYELRIHKIEFEVLHIRGCIQKFPDWPPGASTANGTALCH